MTDQEHPKTRVGLWVFLAVFAVFLVVLVVSGELGRADLSAVAGLRGNKKG